MRSVMRVMVVNLLVSISLMRDVFGLPTSVIVANRGPLSFCFALMVSGSWIFQEVAKSDLGLSIVSEAF